MCREGQLHPERVGAARSKTGGSHPAAERRVRNKSVPVGRLPGAAGGVALFLQGRGGYQAAQFEDFFGGDFRCLSGFFATCFVCVCL